MVVDGTVVCVADVEREVVAAVVVTAVLVKDVDWPVINHSVIIIN